MLHTQCCVGIRYTYVLNQCNYDRVILYWSVMSCNDCRFKMVRMPYLIFSKTFFIHVVILFGSRHAGTLIIVISYSIIPSSTFKRKTMALFESVQ